MSMNEPSPRASRLALAAGLAAVIVVGGGGFLLGQRASNQAVPEPVFSPVPTPVAAVAEPVKRALDRADLIALAALAADATAQGGARPRELDDAVGKRFSIALPFGCNGPAAADSTATMRWQYDEAAGALRFHIAPAALLPANWWPDGAQADAEAIEGFWIARPWTRSESCPARSDAAEAGGTEPVTLPGQTLAIAQIFRGDGTRHGRRDGKPYAAVVRVKPESLRAERGFRIRLTGQVAAAPGGGAALCRQPGGAEQRPICLIATTLDQVEIENPATGETLATWPVGGARQAE